MSEAALTKARKELGWDKYANRLSDFYRSVLQFGQKPRLSEEAQIARAL
jgi:hypothetical protein